VPQVVEAKSALVVSRENSDPDRCWSDVILNHDAGAARLLAFEPGTGEKPICWLTIGRLVPPVLHEPCKERVHRNWSLRRLLSSAFSCSLISKWSGRLRWNGFGRDQVLRTDDRRYGKAARDQTLIAATSEASRIAFIVVIDPSL